MKKLIKMLINNTDKNIVIKCYTDTIFNNIKEQLTKKFKESPILKHMVEIFEVD